MIKWIGQHIWDFVSRFRNDVYLEDIADPGSDTDKFLVVDTNNKIGYRTGAEVLSDIGASSEATDLEFNGSTANGVLTYGGAAQIDVESTFTYDSGALELSSSSSNLPTITLTNSNADINPPAFVFQKTATGANNDDLGVIDFKGDDASNNVETYARIKGQIAEAAHGSEEGRLSFQVASHDGEMQAGLIIASGDAEDEVDVTLGNGSQSIVNLGGQKIRAKGDQTLQLMMYDISSGNTDCSLLLGETGVTTGSIGMNGPSHINVNADASEVLTGTNVSGKNVNLSPSKGRGTGASGKVWMSAPPTHTVSGTSASSHDPAYHVFAHDTVDFFQYAATTTGSLVTIHSNDTTVGNGGELQFKKNAADTEDGEVLGKVTFYGEDEGNNNTQFAEIVASISESDEGDEAGKLEFKVATSDSSTSALQRAFTATGHATNNIVDISLGYGATSTVTVAAKATVLDVLTAGGLSLGGHAVDDIQVAGDTFADVDDQLMSAAAINDLIGAVGGGGGKGFLQWYYYSANLSTTNGFYIEKWNDEYGVSSSINSQITDYNDTSSSHWQLIRGSRIVPYDATVTKFFVNVENSGTNEDIEVALWKASPSVTSRSGSTTATTIDHLCTLSYGFSSYSGSGTWTQSTTSFNATSLTQGDYLFVTLRRTSGSDGSSYHVHSTVTFDY